MKGSLFPEYFPHLIDSKIAVDSDAIHSGIKRKCFQIINRRFVQTHFAILFKRDLVVVTYSAIRMSALLLLFTSFCLTSNALGSKCTGKANCTACSNCSRCQHCKAGGGCGVCAASTPSKKPVYKAPVSENSSKCKAITKAGSRCSRNSRSNGFCWQHGG